jgi:serine protease Do
MSGADPGRMPSVGGRVLLGLVVLAAARLVRAADPGEPTLAEEAAFRAAVARVAAAVVRVEPVAAAVGTGEAATGGGPSTGLVVASAADAAWVLTTAWAVPDAAAETVLVRADGVRQAGRVAGRDGSRGLVLLKTQPWADVPVLEPAPRRDLAPGQWAIAVGRGWGHAAPSVAVGIVSAVDRAWGRAVQTDASVSQANYGGPLIDIAGRVIGILAPLPADTAGMTQGTELYDAGIGFAVPLEDVLPVLPRMQRGEQLAAGILGISWRSRDMINGEPVIASCRQGSPAAVAGLRPGDRVVQIGDRAVARIGAARHEIMPRRAGDTCAVVVERAAADGPRRIEARVTLTDALPPWRPAVIGVLPPPAPEAAAGDGLTVAWLLPEGPAAAAGIRAGEVIRGVVLGAGDEAEGRLPVDGPADLAGVLAGVAPGDAIGVEVVRDGRPRTVAVTTTAAPADVPPAVPGWPPPATDEPAAAAVVKLASPDEPRPPLAVIPRPGGKEAVGVIVYFGSPHGPVAEAEARAWRAAAAAWDVAVILPGSADPGRWSADDLPTIRRSLAALDAKRPIDAARIAVAGQDAGAGFAWFVAERLGAAAKGVALVGAALPRAAAVQPSEPGRTRWVLIGPGGADDVGRRVTADRRRLEAAGFPVGTIAAEGDAPPADTLCRWNVLLGLL